MSSEDVYAVTPEGRVVRLIPVHRYGSEGLEPRDVTRCPFFRRHGVDVACLSGSGDSQCAGFGGTERQGDVWCIYEDEEDGLCHTFSFKAISEKELTFSGCWRRID